MNDSSPMEKSHFSLRTTFLVCMMLLVLLDLTTCMWVMNEISLFQERLSGQELILDLLKERAETGRLYLMNIDHCNSHSSFKDKVEMSNLSGNYTPTKPLQHIDDPEGEIALCILSAVNVGKVKIMMSLKNSAVLLYVVLKNLLTTKIIL